MNPTVIYGRAIKLMQKRRREREAKMNENRPTVTTDVLVEALLDQPEAEVHTTHSLEKTKQSAEQVAAKYNNSMTVLITKTVINGRDIFGFRFDPVNAHKVGDIIKDDYHGSSEVMDVIPARAA